MSKTRAVRRNFLDYFKSKNHLILPSSSLVPHGDPTLMFTNAGMNQFKNNFIGLEQPPKNRITTAQKCVRAGGKHNDLENVGYTARHHTFFEMLGNFSFGDYFKKEAIEMAWELITDIFKIAPDKLLVTVYHEDTEAEKIWRDHIGINPSKIIKIATSDNFWSMGDVGPCGPCSEIFYDHGAHIAGGPPGSPDEDGDRFVEIWNLVFMQYNMLEDSTREALPSPCIDTGAGLERMAAVLQGVHDNYEIDLFQNLIHASKKLLGTPTKDAEISHRVIADHLRSSSFLIADGVLPSNEGRGYVLRRIMRRAMRHIYMLGARKPEMYHLFPTLLNEMGEDYPELSQAKALIQETLKVEEQRFQETLGRGLKVLEEERATLSAGNQFSGDIAFKLYDTYGFPLDLTQDILRADKITVDEAAFEQAMETQRASARAAWRGSGESKEDPLWIKLAKTLPETIFLGYENTKAQGQVLALLQEGAPVSTLCQGRAQLILDQTPFYAESGGQVGDQGWLDAPELKARVLDCQKHAGRLFVHEIEITEGTLSVGDQINLQVDQNRRNQIRANHSATHLLHAVLRRYLGTQVTQKGSLVDPDKLRFDFSLNRAITPVELEQVEREVNRLIRYNSPVKTQLMSPDDAINTGALALFGEKYGDEVRVLRMGIPEEDMSFDAYSIEFCGGTHVQATGDIGLFKIISETGVAAGIRRIEAVTGLGAENYVRTLERQVGSLAKLLKVPATSLESRLESLLKERKEFERGLKELKAKLIQASEHIGSSTSTQKAQKIGEVTYLGRVLDGVAPKDLKPLADQFKKELQSGVVALVTAFDGKASLVVAVTDDLTPTIDAVELVRAGALALGGKGGGGRPDMAQAGGSDITNLQKAIDAIAGTLNQS